ncbi:MAG: hypothetical protein ABSC90_14970 [Acidimicrobiales bacterium]|jgi:hypothetical protein
MTDEIADQTGPEDPFTIGAIIAQTPERPVWFKRTWVLAAAAVAVVAIASVAVDLPSHTTVATDTADQTSIMQQINDGIDGCSYGVKETFTIYQDLRKGSLSSSDRSEVPAMMRDDQTACSFTSSDIYDLSNVEGTGTPAGKNIGNVVNVVTLWATSDALGAIEDIQSLYSDPGDGSALKNLSKQEGALARDRATADADVTAADRILKANLPMPDLPDLPRLAGTN